MSSTIGKFAHIPKELVGATGRRYCFKKLLQGPSVLGCIWVATHAKEKFVLKDLPESLFSHFNGQIWPRLHDLKALLRLPVDTIPGRRTMVYQYLVDDFLHLVKNKISMAARWQIMKNALQAIVELHDRDIVHLDIKPDNILVDYRYQGAVTIVEQVNIIDLENAAHLPSGRRIEGMLAGSENWRSIEGHFKGALGKPTDMFCFGLVCIYAMFDRIICGPDKDLEKHISQGALPTAIRMQRLVSYFGDVEGVNGLMKHLGDEEINCQILSVLWEERYEEYIPYKPFSEWPESEHDKSFKDLIINLTNLDPGKRITASQALRHPWFARTREAK